MRLAAIDIGTNSTKMLIADADTDGRLTVVSEDSVVTRLGEGVDAARRLNDAAVQRTMKVIEGFADSARSQGAVRVLAAGTSALRDAVNGREFIQSARDRAGVEIEIITGDREAELAHAAVHSDGDMRLSPDALLLVFDVGGGSTELISGQGGDLQRHVSLNVGAVRLTERFLQSDPPTQEQINAASTFTDGLLGDFPQPGKTPRVVGIGGTAINIASVTRGLPLVDPDAVHGMTLSADDVTRALAHFRALPLIERRKIPGLETARADVIIGGSLVLSRLLTYFHADSFTVSARGLRYGLLAETAKHPSP